MNVMTLSSLSKTDFNIRNEFSMFQKWKEGESFDIMSNSRPTHALVYFYGCDGEYSLKDGTQLHAKQGEIVFIPSGSSYKVIFKNITNENIGTILINFSLFDQSGDQFTIFDSISIIEVNDNEYFEKSFLKAATIANEVNFSFPKFKAHLYKVFYHLGLNGYLSDMEFPQLAIIENGIAYLENDSSQNMSIEEIAKMCNVSGTYFRKLFKMYSGKSPSEFRLDNKIEQAKRLLETRIYTVSEISDILGFNDVAYFSKMFKKRTGSSPKAYLKQTNGDK